MPNDWLKSVREWDPTSITKSYQKHIGNRPILESAVLGGLLGYGAYRGADTISRFALERMKKAQQLATKTRMQMSGASPEEIEAALAQSDVDVEATLRENRRNGNMRGISKALGGIGLAAGAAYPMLKSYDSGIGAGANIDKYVGADKRTPQQKEEDRYALQAERVHRVGKRQSENKGWGFLNKVSSFQDPLVGQHIPISYSLDLIQRDPFIRGRDKMMVSSIIQGSEEDSGLTNGRGIISTAIRAGVGFVPAYAFGRVISNVAALSPTQASDLSMAGGLAGAIYNTGIIQELMR